MANSEELSELLENYVTDTSISNVPESLINSGFDLLDTLKIHLKNTPDKIKLERYENVLKAILNSICKPDLSGENARKIAILQKEIGFLYKFKSYTIKCVSPLGYSVFLHEPKQGFSFQIHKEHKIEVFHIQEVMPGGYVFLCTYEDWLKTYDKESFVKWLDGEDVPKYDSFKFVPSPGDVFVVNNLNIVHTVIGCIVEEFANISTDNVDRLYDQNSGKPIPETYTVENAYKKLMEVIPAIPKRNIDFQKEWEIKPLISEVIDGIVKTIIVDISFTGIHYIIPNELKTEQLSDPIRHIAIHVWKGDGEIHIGDAKEWEADTPPSIKVTKGDLLFIPANQIYSIKNTSSELLEITEHHIAGNEAFVQSIN